MIAMAWYGWAGIGLGLLILVALLAVRGFRSGRRREFVAFLRANYPDVEVLGTRGSVLGASGGGVEVRAGETTGTIYLAKVHAAVTGLSVKDDTPENRQEIFREFADELIAGMREADQPLSLDHHRKRILVRVVPRAWVAGPPSEPAVPHRTIAGLDLFTVYVLDSPGSVRYLTNSDLDQLGLDLEGVHELALGNLRKQSSPDLVAAVLQENSMVTVKAMDSYDAARILLVPESLGEGEEIAALIPDRDTLTLVNVPTDGNWRPLRNLARVPASEHLLIDRPIRVTRAGFEVV